MDENKELQQYYEKNGENFSTQEEYWDFVNKHTSAKKNIFDDMKLEGMLDQSMSYEDWNASRFGGVKKKDNLQQIVSEDSTLPSGDSELVSGDTETDLEPTVDLFQFDDEEYVNKGGFQDKSASYSEIEGDILNVHNNWNQQLESQGVTNLSDLNFAGVVDSEYPNEDYYKYLTGTDLPDKGLAFGKNNVRKQGRGSQNLINERNQIIQQIQNSQDNEGLDLNGELLWEKDSDIIPAYQDKFSILSSNVKKKYTPKGQEYLDRLKEINNQLDFDNQEAIQANFNYRRALYNSVNKKPDNFNNSSDAFVLSDEMSNGIDNIQFGGLDEINPELYSPKLFTNFLTNGEVDEDILSGIQQTIASERGTASYGALAQARLELQNSEQPFTEESLRQLVASNLDDNEKYTRKFFQGDEVYQKWFNAKDEEELVLNKIAKLESELGSETDPEIIKKLTEAISRQRGELQLIQQEFESLSKQSKKLDMEMMFNYKGDRVDKNLINQSLDSDDPGISGPSKMLYQFNKDVADKVSKFTNILDEEKDVHELLNIYHGLVDSDKYYQGLLDSYQLSLTPGTWRKKIPGFSRKAYDFYLNNVKDEKNIGDTFNFEDIDYETSLFQEIDSKVTPGTFKVEGREGSINDDEIWVNKMSLGEAFDLFGAPEVDSFLGKSEVNPDSRDIAKALAESEFKIHNIDNRVFGAPGGNYANDGLELRVDRLKEQWLKGALENRANLRAMSQVLHFNTDPGSFDRGGFLNASLFGEGFAEGLVNLPIDAANFVKRNLGVEEVERYDMPTVEDFQSEYVRAANDVGYDITEDQLEEGTNGIAETTMYGIGNILPAVGLQTTLLFPATALGVTSTIAGLSRYVYAPMRKSLGFSKNLKSMYSAEQLSKMRIGKNINTFEDALKEQKSIAHTYNLMRQWSYAQGDVGKIMWNIGESATMTGLTFQLTPGEHFTPYMGAGLGAGATAFKTIFPMTKSGEQIYKNFISGKSKNSFIPGKAQVGAINWVGETASGTFAMYTGELTDHWIGHGIPFREAVATTIGTSGEEQVDKLVSAVMFAAGFSTMHSASFVAKGKETIMKDIVNGPYPENVRSYARRALSSLEFYESAPAGSLLREMMNNNVSLKELLENDKFSFAFPELKEDIVRYKNTKQLESDLSNRLQGESPETFSIISGSNPMGKKLSAKENASRNEQLRAELEKRGYKFQETQFVAADGSIKNSFYIPSMDAKVASQVGRLFGQESILSDGGQYFLFGPNQGQMFKTTGELNVSNGFKKNYFTMPIGETSTRVRTVLDKNLSPVEFNYGVPKANMIKSDDFKWDKSAKEYNYTIEVGEGTNPAVQLTIKRNAEGEFVLSGRNIDLKDIEGPLGVSDKNAAVSKVKELVRSNLEQRIGERYQPTAAPVEFEFNKNSRNQEQAKEHGEKSSSIHNDSKGSLSGSGNYVMNNVFPERNVTITKGNRVTEKEISDFKKKNADILENQNFAVSTRIDKTGDTVLEIVGVVGNKNFEYAKELARSLNLPEMIDMSNGKSIKTNLKSEPKSKMSRNEILDAFTEVEVNSNQKNLSLKLIDRAISGIEGSPEMTGENFANKDFPNALKNVLMKSKQEILDGVAPREAAENAIGELLKMTENINKKMAENKSGSEPIVLGPFEMVALRNMIMGVRDFKSSLNPNVGPDGITRTSEAEMQRIMNEKNMSMPEIKSKDVDLVGGAEFTPQQFMEYINKQQTLDIYANSIKRNLIHENSPLGEVSLKVKERMLDDKIRFKQKLKDMVNAKINEDFARLPSDVRSELAESAYNSIVQLENSATAAHITKLKLEPILREIYGGMGRSHLSRGEEVLFNSIVRVRTNISNWKLQDSRKLKADELVDNLNSKMSELIRVTEREYKNPENKQKRINEINQQIQDIKLSLSEQTKKISLGENVIEAKSGEDGVYRLMAKIRGIEGENVVNKGIGKDVFVVNGEPMWPWQIKNTAVEISGLGKTYPTLETMERNLSNKISEYNRTNGENAYADRISPRVEKLREFYQKQAEYLYEEGLISLDAKNEMLGRDFYSPKLYVQYIKNYEQTNPNIKGKDNWSSPIKFLSEGSGEMQSQNQFNLLNRYMLGLENKVQKNRTYKNIHDYILKLENSMGFGGADFGFKVKENQSLDVLISQINASRKSKGLTEISKNDYIQTHYMEGGKEQNFMISREMFDVVNNKYSQEIFGEPGFFDAVGGYFTNVFKTLKTGARPAFALVNFPRDIMHTMMYTDYYSPILPVAGVQMTKDFMTTAKAAFGPKNMNNKAYYDYIINGGGMEFYSLMGTDARSPLSLGYEIQPGEGFFGKAREIFEKSTSPLSPTGRTAKLKRAALDVLQYPGLTSEVWVRMAVANRMTNQYINEATKDANITREKGESVEAFAQRAGLGKQQILNIKRRAVNDARNTIDFSQSGSIGSRLNTFLPYSNAALQGFRISARALRDNPVTSGVKIMQMIGLGMAQERLLVEEHGDWYEKQRKRNPYLFQTYNFIPTGVKDENGMMTFGKVAKDHASMPWYALGAGMYRNMKYGEDMWDGSFGVFATDEQKNDILQAFEVGWNPLNVLKDNQHPLYSAIMNYKTNQDNIGRRFSPLFKSQISSEMEFERGRTPNIIIDAVGKYNKLVGEDLKISPDRSMGFLSGLGFNKEHYTFRAPSTMYDEIMGYLSPEEQKEIHGMQINDLKTKYSDILPQILHIPSEQDSEDYTPRASEWRTEEESRKSSNALEIKKNKIRKIAGDILSTAYNQAKNGEEEKAEATLEGLDTYIKESYDRLQKEGIISDSEVEGNVRMLIKQFKDSRVIIDLKYDGTQKYIHTMKRKNPKHAAEHFVNHIKYWEGVVAGDIKMLPEHVNTYKTKDEKVEKLSQVQKFMEQELILDTKFFNAVNDILSGKAIDPEDAINKYDQIMKDLYKSK